jgi:ABC-type Fe3+/spermidine/putrescine transport system ATPase subunit
VSFVVIDALTKRFGGVAAVDGLSLGIERSEFVTLLGPSGCGKTTALRLIAGFLAPDAGTIAVGGRRLSSPDRVVPPESRGMGMVFQNYAVWPHLSVFDNVAYGLRARRVADKLVRTRVASTLERLALSALSTRYPHELSGGQQQRVALARSLVVEPEIVLLDEPLSNLDAALRESARAELKRMQRESSGTFVYVTHDRTEALAISDRIAVLSAGRLAQVGAPRELYARPSTLFVAEALGAANVLRGACVSRAGDALRAALPGGAELTVALPADSRLDARAQEVTVVVRPESIELNGGRREGVNAFEGVVSELAFLGDRTEFRVECAAGPLRVQALPGTALSEDERVHVYIPPSACTIVREE